MHSSPLGILLCACLLALPQPSPTPLSLNDKEEEAAPRDKKRVVYVAGVPFVLGEDGASFRWEREDETYVLIR